MSLSRLRKIHEAGIGHYGSVRGDDEFKKSVDASTATHAALLDLADACTRKMPNPFDDMNECLICGTKYRSDSEWHRGSCKLSAVIKISEGME